jgi:hypothetical protein
MDATSVENIQAMQRISSWASRQYIDL